jgi:hypothetical protein
MDDLATTTLDTTVQTAEQLLPSVIAGVAAAADPKVAAIVQVAPIAMQLLQSAMQLESAGALTGDQLAAMFANIGKGVQATHDAWTALNAAVPAA